MMKRLLWLLAWALLAQGCTDDCTSEMTYSIYHPVYMSYAELRQPIAPEAPKNISQTGKIYLYQQYLLVNEPKRGIHILDNANPAAPQKISFIPIPGNVDMAIQDNILYADNYVDLLVFDISNPRQVQMLNRVKNVFPQEEMQWNRMGTFDPSQGVVVEWEEEVVTEEVECGGRGWIGRPEFTRFTDANIAGGATVAPPSNQTGIGGSMARFTISQGHLYAVTWYSLIPMQISDPVNPNVLPEVRLGFGIETIFPYQDKLFIGAQNGMHIYDVANPAAPERLSMYRHINACDPVVVQGRYAYVTLRSGTECDGFSNQLDVVDISDLRNPQLFKTFEMANPHGLAIDGDRLFICEGEFGLKYFDASNPAKIGGSLLAHYDNFHAFDVIAYQEVLMMIGRDGLYQYDYSDPTALKLLSVIQIVPEN